MSNPLVYTYNCNNDGSHSTELDQKIMGLVGKYLWEIKVSPVKYRGFLKETASNILGIRWYKAYAPLSVPEDLWNLMKQSWALQKSMRLLKEPWNHQTNSIQIQFIDLAWWFVKGLRNKSIQIQFIKANEPLLRQKKTWLVKTLVLWVDLLG